MLKNFILAASMLVFTAQDKPVAQPSPEQVVQQQLEAYNAHDIERFLSCYADNVQSLELGTGKIYRNGIKEFRTAYSELFKTFPKLKCTVVSRIVQGDFVVDKEVLEGTVSPVVYATAVYHVSKGKIIKVWFL